MTAVVVLAVPLVAKVLDDSADSFNSRHFTVGAALGWMVVAVLAAIVVTRRLPSVLSIEEGSGLAIVYDVLPILLILAWLIEVVALSTGHWLLALVAGGLCVYHLVLLVPRLIAARRPWWTRDAPTIDIVVANVYVDNETPADAARQLVATDADVVIILESTPSFIAIFDGAGGADAFPHRVTDPDDHSDYAVTLVAKSPSGPRSKMADIGPLRLAIGDVDVGGTSTLVIGLNPMATVDPGGHDTWKEQIEALKEFVQTLTGPVIIAGDLNTTRYRPEFEELLELGFSDAIDSLGKGLNPSFKLSSDGVLGQPRCCGPPGSCVGQRRRARDRCAEPRIVRQRSHAVPAHRRRTNRFCEAFRQSKAHHQDRNVRSRRDGSSTLSRVLQLTRGAPDCAPASVSPS